VQIPADWKTDFARESLYLPEAWFIDELLLLDEVAGVIRARTDTTRLGFLVDAQRELPGHDKHLPGAVAIQITGTLGQLHATYLLGLRPSEGWVGFGTHLKKARFPRMGRIGPPLEVEARVLRSRKLRNTVFSEYAFAFTQEGELVYESEQTAAFFDGKMAMALAAARSS
jgi:3-hydroxymyristoyl/3-hydroxydecanoyl-(acyl carrier protein) dehydratase